MDEEEELKSSLEMYQSQLSQVELALQASGDNEDLIKLKEDMQQLISLTQDSLLALKKSKLFSMLNEGQSQTKPTATSSMDDEFAAFQAAIAEDDTSGSLAYPAPSTSNGSSKLTTSSNRQSDSGDDEDDNNQLSDLDSINASLDEIIGTKCRAPFQLEWGGRGYYNAMIMSVLPMDEDTEPKVKVLFCNPTNATMKPCTYLLEGTCKFSDDECRFSHGYTVNVEDLKEYTEPDYNLLKLECPCMAKYLDGLWYKGVIVDVLEDNMYKVLFSSYENTETLSVEDIVPITSNDDDSPELSDDEVDHGSDQEEEQTQVYVWVPPKTTDALGEWEKHTKGIGSRLMAKMGYITGQGLGRNGEGRAVPVPIQLLPQGKSLDKIMEMRERSGDQNLFDAMNRQKRKQKKVDKKAAAGYAKKKVGYATFEFLNNKLGGKKGNIHDLVKTTKKSTQKTHISEKDLKSRSDRHINIQLFQTHEEMKNVQKKLVELKQSLKRNAGQEKITVKLKEKISSLESYLNQLKSSENSISKHKHSRRDQKKMTEF